MENESTNNEEVPAIVRMRPDEVQELLIERGIEATEAQAETIQRIVAECGSLEAVLAIVEHANDRDAA